jgi:hypothetical protein
MEAEHRQGQAAIALIGGVSVEETLKWTWTPSR